MDSGSADCFWEGRPPCRPLSMQERLSRLTAHRESWIFILFLNCWRSTRRSTLPNRIAQPPQNRGINPLATVFASGSWEGRPPRRPVSMQERLTRLTAHRESWIFILFLNCWRSTRRSTLPNRMAQPPQNRGINPLATVFASGSWEGRPPRRPVPMQERLTRLTAHKEP
jgi:hypothetical protein